MRSKGTGKVARRARRPASKPAPRVRPLRESQHVNERAWYYEAPGSVLVVAEVHDAEGGYLGTAQVRIPWAKLAKSANRCGWVMRRAE